jgi:hypothetical protein
MRRRGRGVGARPAPEPSGEAPPGPASARSARTSPPRDTRAGLTAVAVRVGRWLRVVVIATCCWFSLLCPSAARAQGYQNNDYAIDLFTGPVLGAGRIVGMAGAYTAIATGIDGAMFNPAGYAERHESEIDWYEWELTGGISLGGLFHRNDFDNNGGRNELSSVDAMMLSGGMRLQFGDVGGGATIVLQNYTLSNGGRAYADVTFMNLRAGAAYSFFDGGLVAGVSVRNVIIDISETDSSESLVYFSGLGAELGALIRPAGARYRVGAAVRTPVDSKPQTEAAVEVSNGVRTAGGLVLPARVHVPWELAVGFAYQFGERRSNAPWRNTSALRSQLRRQIADGTYEPPDTYGGPPYPALSQHNPRAALRTAIDNDREAQRRYLRAQPRRYVLLSAEVLLFRPTHKGQGVNAFLRQSPERSGARMSYGARVGLESELLPNRLKLRGGSYLEPSRYQRNYYRPHVTGGMDVRLFDAWRWSVRGTATVDVAPRYYDWGLSLGLWY